MLTFLSDWHVSSGLGSGFLADSVLLRDSDGFPFISGRAMKGALREGARRIGLCRKDLANAVNFFFGTNQDVDTNTSGLIRISSAQIPAILKAQIAGCENKTELISDLTVLRKQTAIDTNGLAKSSSLRSIECGIQGLELNADLDVMPTTEIDDAWIEEYFAAVCASVKNIGGGRSRGMGRCLLRFANYTAKITLPKNNAYLESLGGQA